MSNYTMKVKAGRVPVNTGSFIGEAGTIFWDMFNGQLRLSDGHTAGGIGLLSTELSASPPTNPNQGSLWYDISGGRLYVYYLESWVDASPTTRALVNQSLVTKNNNSPGTTGDLAYDDNYIYICVATDTWKRVALSGGSF